MLPIQRKISSYNHYNNNSVQYIVCHYTGATGTAKNNADYFYGGNRGASAHYFVDDNSIWQSVEDYHGAWHVGDGKNKYGINNQNSIGIEMCCQNDDNLTVSAKTEANTLELVKYLMKKYNVPIGKVVRHYDASRKACPNWSANNWARWWNFKKKLTNTAASTPAEVAYPNVYYRVRCNGRWLSEVKNLEDYAGIQGQPITDVAMRVDKGSIKYRVHTRGGSWLGWITGCNINNIYGYAGNGRPIDAIQVYYNTPSDVVKGSGYKYARYRVSPLNSNYYSWQLDNNTNSGMDGYAGSYGKTIDKLQIILI